MAFERMACKYDTLKDLSDRLGSTICRYKGSPVLVIVEKVNCLRLYDPSGNNIIASITPDDPDFDISSPELGYLNTGKFELGQNTAAYAIRIPYRRFKQGLFNNSVKFETIDGETRDKYTTGPLFGTEGFSQSIMGIFPELPVAFDFLGPNFKNVEVAISQDIALKMIDSGLLLVFFKTKNIGWMHPGTSIVIAKKGEFNWVLERYLSRVGLSFSEA